LGDINKIDELRREFNLFLVSDHAHPWAEPSDIFRNVRWGDAAKMFDAIMPGDGVYVPEEVGRWEEYKRRGYEKWSEFCKSSGIGFIPNVTVGISYRNCPWGDKSWPPVPRSPELFKKRLEIALPYVNKKLRMIILSEFNNYLRMHI